MGILHYTGAVWNALENSEKLVAPGVKLYIVIYNDQGLSSKVWLIIKRIYNEFLRILRRLVLAPTMVRLCGPHSIFDFQSGRPFYILNHYSEHITRGMSAWYDVLYWVRSLSFEVAKLQVLFDFLHQTVFRLVKLKAVGGK